MTPSNTCSRERRRAVRGWGLLFLVAALYGGWWAADRYLERAPHAGFCPAGYQWAVFLPDLPAFWRQVQRQPVAASAAQEAPQWLHRAELAVRAGTGVRPTPARWRTWLGGQALLAGQGAQWCLCVRPGVLARCADFVNRLVGGGTETGGIYRFGELYYRWRDGYLLVSPAMESISLALTSEPFHPATSLGSDMAYLAWNGPASGYAQIRAAEGFPFSGFLQGTFHPCGEPVPGPGSWPGKPLFVISGCNGESLLQAAGLAFASLPSTPVADLLRRGGALIRQRWGLERLLAPGEAHGPRSFSLACFDAEVSEALLLPEWALALTDHNQSFENHPLWPMISEAGPLPFIWNGHDGWAAPVLGEELTLCITEKEGWWIVSSREPLMARILEPLSLKEAPESSFLMYIDWKLLGETLVSALRQAASLELIPRMNLKDVDSELVPLARLLSACHWFTLNAQIQEDGALLQGFLTGSGEPLP